jgi:hypothetical protein
VVVEYVFSTVLPLESLTVSIELTEEVVDTGPPYVVLRITSFQVLVTV